MDNQNDDLKDKKILVFGLGVEGESLVRYFAQRQFERVLVFDQKENIGQTKEYLGYRITNLSEEAMRFAPNVIFRSPGVKISTIKELFGENEISSATNLFMSEARGTIVGVTGTKGKSTTSNLLKAVLTSNDKQVFLGGNIGNSPLDFVDQTTDRSFSIIELSSFQLQDIKIKPHVAVFLPVSVDHMNYHESESEYIKAKKEIVSSENQGQIVIMPVAQQELADVAAGIKVTYSISNGTATCSPDGNDFCCSDRRFNVDLDVLSKKLATPDINVSCVLAFCFALKLDFHIEDIAEKFEKPEFRMQKVGHNKDMNFYNDSASTNPASIVEAVKLMDKNFALICGGSSKGLDYDQMGQIIAKNHLLKKVYVIGETGREIYDALSGGGYDKNLITEAQTLEDAMRQISQNHKDVDEVLFSSGSASFDQFKNYRERGEYFNRLVDKWPNI